MSSNLRSPKDLKDMVSASRMDVDEMEQNLSKLRGLSKDDKTEKAMLRSRIDEQSQLICILKTRADEATSRLQALEKVNDGLYRFRDDAHGLIAEEIRKFTMLNTRFHELAENHEEMIRIKDEYKAKNVILNQQNRELMEENKKLFSAAIQERDFKIKLLEKTTADLQEKCQNYEKIIRDLNSTLESKQAALHAQLHEQQRRSDENMAQVKKKLEETELQLTEVTNRLNKMLSTTHSTETSHQAAIDKLTKEKSDLTQQVIHRGKLVQAKQAETQSLQEKLTEAEKKLQQMDEKFEREVAAVNANLQVKKLRGELQDTDQKLSQIQKEFEAYRLHTNSLLTKERDLNAKLRKLTSI